MRSHDELPSHEDIDERRYSLADLTEETGVSVRTVRYYITEGLLPPPVTAGARSYYTPAHRDRLQVIGQMKDAYLPLREIRRRLTGLDDADVHRLAIGDDEDELSGVPTSNARYDLRQPSSPTPSRRLSEPMRARESTDSASSYIARVMGRSIEVPPTLPAAAASEPRFVASEPERRDMEQDPERSPPDGGRSWRRVAIADGAELLIDDALFVRQREKIDWLVDWARRVLS